MHCATFCTLRTGPNESQQLQRLSPGGHTAGGRGFTIAVLASFCTLPMGHSESQQSQPLHSNGNTAGGRGFTMVKCASFCMLPVGHNESQLSHCGRKKVHVCSKRQSMRSRWVTTNHKCHKPSIPMVTLWEEEALRWRKAPVSALSQRVISSRSGRRNPEPKWSPREEHEL